MTPKTSERGKSKQAAKKEITFFDLLKQDHDKVRDMFEQIEEEDAEARPDLFSELQSELLTHLELEEKFFYPVLEETEDARQKALEAYEEHNVAKTVLGECSKLDADDERWEAKIKVLQEIVNHHLQEEEKVIFKMAKKIMEKEQIQKITGQIRQQKSEVEKKAA